MEQDQYLLSLLPESSGLIKEMEHFAEENGVPIMEPEGIHFLMQLIRLHQPEKILEVGTAIGYSALRMLEAAPSSQIITIERDYDRYTKALDYMKQLNIEDSIQLLFGNALELEDEAKEKGPYDLLFIDAAKGKYEEFFTMFVPMLSEHGVIITDNVLFKGFVADDQQASKRMAKLAKKIRAFNEWLTNHEDYHTVIVPVGDGIAITTKK